MILIQGALCYFRKSPINSIRGVSKRAHVLSRLLRCGFSTSIDVDVLLITHFVLTSKSNHSHVIAQVRPNGPLNHEYPTSGARTLKSDKFYN